MNVGDILGKCVYLGEDTFLKPTSRYKTVAKFKCAYCDNTFMATFFAVRNLQKSSCGCKSRTHGLSGTKEYVAWISMKTRCYDVNFKFYPHYGGRGIKVCERWLDEENGFTNFLSDMGKSPSPNHSVDRFPNNDGDYEPSNCRWGTQVQQRNNNRNTPFITFNGKTKSVSDWVRETGISRDKIIYRLQNNYPVERIFIKEDIYTPKVPYERVLKILALYHTSPLKKVEIASIYGLSKSTINNYIREEQKIIDKYKLSLSCPEVQN